jgi:hypothetical protein
MRGGADDLDADVNCLSDHSQGIFDGFGTIVQSRQYVGVYVYHWGRVAPSLYQEARK